MRKGEYEAASCQFYESPWRIELSSFGRSERREGIAAIVAITAVGEVTRDTMGEKGMA